MSVQEYLDKHMLSRRIEDAVNAAVRSKSPDPVLFISNHLKKSVPAAITKIRARQIFDSRGVPTVEVDLYTNKGMFRAAAPSGAVPGTYAVLTTMRIFVFLGFSDRCELGIVVLREYSLDCKYSSYSWGMAGREKR